MNTPEVHQGRDQHPLSNRTRPDSPTEGRTSVSLLPILGKQTTHAPLPVVSGKKSLCVPMVGAQGPWVPEAPMCMQQQGSLGDDSRKKVLSWSLLSRGQERHLPAPIISA